MLCTSVVLFLFVLVVLAAAPRPVEGGAPETGHIVRGATSGPVFTELIVECGLRPPTGRGGSTGDPYPCDRLYLKKNVCCVLIRVGNVPFAEFLYVGVTCVKYLAVFSVPVVSLVCIHPLDLPSRL